MKNEAKLLRKQLKSERRKLESQNKTNFNLQIKKTILEEKENVARKEIQNLNRTIEVAKTENVDQGRLLDEVEKQNERYENKNEKLHEYQKSAKNMR